MNCLTNADITLKEFQGTNCSISEGGLDENVRNDKKPVSVVLSCVHPCRGRNGIAGKMAPNP
jgi:hypothetical protein